MLCVEDNSGGVSTVGPVRESGIPADLRSRHDGQGVSNHSARPRCGHHHYSTLSGTVTGNEASTAL
ncbi:hypothetical protein H4V95_000707 [Arthrobacter sp. CAN_C5]|nr:hypothetical protein [Arthrobacter sp. CAN_C5]